MIPNLINYTVAREATLPPIRTGLYEYVLAGNGLFVRSERKGLKALIPVAACNVHGLATVEPYVAFALPRVPVELTRAVLRAAQQARIARADVGGRIT
jgi:hypothetical protein